MKKILLSLSLLALALGACRESNPGAAAASQADSPDTLTAALRETKFTNDELLGWRFTGIGKFYNESGRQVCLMEGEGSQGVGIFSPAAYLGDVVLRYKIMPLNAATVLVNLLCMGDDAAPTELTLPADYDGSMAPILSKANYFIAFRNSPHATAPFISRNPGMSRLVIADRDAMIPGVYYEVEAGRVGNRVWLKVDGQEVVSAEDPEILPGGFVAIRLRGLVGHPAACVIRDLSVWSE